LPIYHVHGLFVALHGALLNGSTMIWHQAFDAGAVIGDFARATILMGVPTFYVRLAADPRLTREAAAGMRLFVSGSAPLLDATFDAFEARTGHRILERYGMTEAGMICSNPYEGERIAGTVAIVGRARDLIIAGGLNIYPREIELALDAIPGVTESAVIGLPHPDLGEAVAAVVVRADPALDEAALLAAIAGELARFKQPRRILFADALPRNAMGKVQKAALREAHKDLFAD